MTVQLSFTVQTQGRGMMNVTTLVRDQIADAKIKTGLCNLFLHHTSASLILCENADEAVKQDLEAFMSRLIPDGDPLFKHTAEGPDDMPSHVRSILTQNSLTIPITNGQLNLGTWQGIYIWEHRLAPYSRRLTVTIW